ncbi:MAG: hypothetical protein WBE40_08430 [Thermoplasmata archaeon]
MVSSYVRKDRQPLRWGWAAAFVALLLLLAIPASGAASEPSAAASPLVAASAPSHTVTDGQTISTSAPRHSTLTDSLTYGESTTGQRSYTIHITVSVALPGVALQVTTYPIAQWGLPDQLPGGADSLPPLSLWTWNVSDDGHMVTSGWTATTWDQRLSGDSAWTNQTIWVRGSTAPHPKVTVTPSEGDGTFAPGVGFVLNTPGVAGQIPTNDSTFTTMASALDPSIVRFSTTMAGVDESWDVFGNQPKFNFAEFDRLASFSKEVGGSILLTLPAGSWGDGNLLPTGMPLNLSISVPGPDGAIGYFPNNAAWVAYVEGIVNHTMGLGEHIAYWSIGNEFPDASAALVTAYTNLFNLAAKTIHSKLPHALVGSDAMTNTTYERYFATHAEGVGFLSFHYYPSVGLCVKDGVYCPPQGAPLGSTDEGIFSHAAYSYLGTIYAPKTAQQIWYDETGAHLPILNTETSLNGAGGTVTDAATGTDPRTQTLFGASWLISLLIDSAHQNVSELSYFALSSGWGIPNTLTSPYGGWGFGLTAEAPGDTNTLYAPYLALRMWAAAIPAHAAGREATSSEPSVVHVYSALDGSSLSVVIENRVNVPVTVSVHVAGGKYTLSSATVLDGSSYDMVYEPSEHRTVLKSDSTRAADPKKDGNVILGGYGVAVAKYTLTKAGPQVPTAKKPADHGRAPSGAATSAASNRAHPSPVGTGAPFVGAGPHVTPFAALFASSWSVRESVLLPPAVQAQRAPRSFGTNERSLGRTSPIG